MIECLAAHSRTIRDHPRHRTRHRESRNGSSGLVPLSVPELRRLITRLTRPAHHTTEFVLHWSY